MIKSIEIYVVIVELPQIAVSHAGDVFQVYAAFSSRVHFFV